MTPERRKQHIESLKQTLRDMYLNQDAYGSFRLNGSKDYRIKFLDNNFRFERRTSEGKWLLIIGNVLVQTTVDEMKLLGQKLIDRTTGKVKI